jgi:hypothetical protein
MPRSAPSNRYTPRPYARRKKHSRSVEMSCQSCDGRLKGSEPSSWTFQVVRAENLTHPPHGRDQSRHPWTGHRTLSLTRADSGIAITSAPSAETGTVAAYEADMIDPADNLGWSVTVVGVTHQVTDPGAAAFRRALAHWADANDQIISMSPGIVTGVRLLGLPPTSPRWLSG